ncbi:MAG: TadE/TadG family type IV pilus assembly protein [Anaerolineae bacterium]
MTRQSGAIGFTPGPGAPHRGRPGGILGRFCSDRRGGTAVQAIVLLPVILFFFLVAIKLWEVVNVRRSLHDGTYAATRYLGLYPPPNADAYYWEQIARRFIEAELLSNPWVKVPVTDADLRVDITIYDGNECGDEFRVEVGYRLFGPVGGRGSGSYSGMLPNNALMTLREDRDGKVICD